MFVIGRSRFEVKYMLYEMLGITCQNLESRNIFKLGGREKSRDIVHFSVDIKIIREIYNYVLNL